MCAMRQLSELNKQGMRACAEKDWNNAEFLLTQALNQGIAIGSNVLEAKLRNNIGIMYTLSGRHQEAHVHFSSALDKLTTKIGKKGKFYHVLCDNIQKNTLRINTK
ncbi:tetratricopeptide repeat protein [Desulfovibrio litoralis]|uniref:Tetratricopeptide repeat-containing protein n=1 Tax=Desulfovibrio litoralis DSM 11393 TaxID=1121455 RepID=A0A1M7SZ33_9BACT|nr:tetratricopeptide repeat protein [Desulfovibrio litoralis]SHN63654.1 hypothetical protein SAMN02745728_01393 [Desulfovibrio litoralis DSM 11393]